MSQTFQDHAQTVAFQDHLSATFQYHSSRPIFSTSNIALPCFPAMTGASTPGHLRFPQHQQPQAATATDLPRAHLLCATEIPIFGGYGGPRITNLSASGTLPIYSTQMAPNTSSMVIDMTAMAKVIPNMPLFIVYRPF